jgi:hypothetical protein
MKGIIVAYAESRGKGNNFLAGSNHKKGWGYIRSENKNIFFHTSNSPDFHPVLGASVEFDLAPPFRLGQADQAINIAPVGVESGAAGGK